MPVEGAGQTFSRRRRGRSVPRGVEVIATNEGRRREIRLCGNEEAEQRS
jgi:hypothetical protein